MILSRQNSIIWTMNSQLVYKKVIFSCLAGMERVILKLLEQGETLFVLQNGIWSHRAAELGRRLGLNVQRVVVHDGQVVNLEMVEKV